MGILALPNGAPHKIQCFGFFLYTHAHTQFFSLLFLFQFSKSPQIIRHQKEN